MLGLIWEFHIRIRTKEAPLELISGEELLERTNQSDTWDNVPDRFIACSLHILRTSQTNY